VDWLKLAWLPARICKEAVATGVDVTFYTVSRLRDSQPERREREPPGPESLPNVVMLDSRRPPRQPRPVRPGVGSS
jgi:hypothetical protein